MRFPKFIKKGDAIGFVAPSFGCDTEPYKTAFGRRTSGIWGLVYRSGQTVMSEKA